MPATREALIGFQKNLSHAFDQACYARDANWFSEELFALERFRVQACLSSAKRDSPNDSEVSMS